VGNHDGEVHDVVAQLLQLVLRKRYIPLASLINIFVRVLVKVLSIFIICPEE
jgi:hypothetical protein